MTTNFPRATEAAARTKLADVMARNRDTGEMVLDYHKAHDAATAHGINRIDAEEFDEFCAIIEDRIARVNEMCR